MGCDIFDRVGMLQTGGYPIGAPIIIDQEGEPSVVMYFMDAEMDVFEVQFSPDPDSPFEIRTGGMSHISTSGEQLCEIAEMKLAADTLWKTLRAFWDNEEYTWVGWEHLATNPDPGFTEPADASQE